MSCSTEGSPVFQYRRREGIATVSWEFEHLTAEPRYKDSLKGSSLLAQAQSAVKITNTHTKPPLKQGHNFISHAVPHVLATYAVALAAGNTLNVLSRNNSGVYAAQRCVAHTCTHTLTHTHKPHPLFSVSGPSVHRHWDRETPPPHTQSGLWGHLPTGSPPPHTLKSPGQGSHARG